LTKSRRRCALCFYHDNDAGVKEGQIAHIDRDSSNSSEGNLIFLCLPHHDKYDSKPSQSKGLQPNEAKTAKSYLEEKIKKDFPGLVKESALNQHTPMLDVDCISIEVYDRRYPVYATFWKFVLSILSEVEVHEQERAEFVQGITDALFLFDDEIDKYLDEVHRQAMKLRGAVRTINQGAQVDDLRWQEAIKKEGELMNWFEKELMNGKHLFARYLRLAS